MNTIKNIFQKYWPVFVIAVLWFIFSSPYFIKGLIPFPSTYLVSNFAPWSASYGMPVKNNAMPDVITQIFPWKTITVDSWKSGEIPLWNPLSFSGSVHAGNYQTAVFSPFTLLFFFLSFIDAWSVMILLQPLLAGFGMFFLLKALGQSNKASLLGSIGFMFCGFMTTWMAYGTLGYALLYLPFIAWSISRYIKRNIWYMPIIGSLGVACSFFSGHFQISLYVLAIAFLYCLSESHRTGSWKRGIVMLIALCSGICIAAPQLFLTFDAFQASVRSLYTNSQEVIPWQYLVTLISPDFYGNPVTRNDWFGHYAEWASYIGIVPLLFSFYAIVYSMDRRKWFFTFLCVGTLLLAYASPLTSLIFTLRIPVLSTSAASRIICMTSFSLCILSGFGFDQLLYDWKKETWKKRIHYFIGMAILMFSLWCILILWKPFAFEQLLIAKRNLVLPTLLSIGTMILMFTGFMKIPYKIIILPCTCILLSCFDSYRYASKWMPFDSREFVYPDTKIKTEIIKRVPSERIFGNIGYEFGSTVRIPLIEGYDAMYQGRYGEFIGAVSDGIVKRPERSVVSFDKHGRYGIDALQLLGVKFILHRLSDGRNVWAFPYWTYGEDVFKSLYRDEHYELLEYKDAFPRMFFASSYVIREDPQEIIDTLFDKDFDRRSTLVVEKQPIPEPKSGSGSIEKVKHTFTKEVVKVKTDVPMLLFRSEVFDPGWDAFIDGRKSVLYRADYDFQAVAVPAGEHTIAFSYWPLSFSYGLFISCIGIGVLGVLIYTHVRKKTV